MPQTLREPFNAHSRRSIERAINHYLEDCYRRRTCARVGEFAERLGLTRPHVSDVVLATFGKPLSAVFHEKQLQHAEDLLVRQPELRISEIAIRSGFGTERTFLRVFRAYRNTTPTAFRKDLTKCQ